MQTLTASKTQSWLSWFLRGLLLFGFLFLVARVFELQIIKGAYFRSLSEGNRIRRVPITAPRGKILARGGEVLVANKEIKKGVIFHPETGFEKVDDTRGVRDDEIITEWERTYPLGEKFAHLGGYLGQVNPSEVGKINPLCPEKGPRKPGSLVGRSGLEEQYDCTLSGVDGEELVEVNTLGKKVRILGRRPAIAGEDLKTSVNFGLQLKVAELMKDKKGAAVVTDAKGEVLALYSFPSFDPAKVRDFLNDPDLPLFNRAIGGLYHPGSVFKPVVAIAALSEGKIDKDFIFEDPGVITVGKFSYANWYFTQYGKTEGKINLVRALARSTDTFFYQLGELVGAEKLGNYANIFGLDKETGVDLPGEIAGLVPSPEWKMKVKGEPWFLGNTYHMAIGQGDLSLTPIGLNRATEVVASNGQLCTPSVAGASGCRDTRIKKAYLKLVREGMVEACSSGGTGYTFFDWNSGPSTDRSGPVACKTGTAETNEDGKTHAWFTVFGPADAPEIVATVLVERSGEGSKVAGPIAREIFNYWFHGRNP